MPILSLITVVIPVGPSKPAVSNAAPTPVAVQPAAPPKKSGKPFFKSVLPRFAWVFLGAIPQSKRDSPASFFLFH